MINVNKIDPRIMQIVVEKTLKNNVHKKESEVFADKDGKHRDEGRRSVDDIRRKLNYANRVFKENEIDIFLVLNEEVLGKRIEILVYESSSKLLLATLDEEKFMHLLEELDMKSGIILDTKG
ncbi:MAG: hypothetical protein U9Q80_07080 [Bacillota bacterium]|nr:hypothetical protein [Bacillota bacterium]